MIAPSQAVISLYFMVLPHSACVKKAPLDLYCRWGREDDMDEINRPKDQ